MIIGRRSSSAGARRRCANRTAQHCQHNVFRTNSNPHSEMQQAGPQPGPAGPLLMLQSSVVPAPASSVPRSLFGAQHVEVACWNPTCSCLQLLQYRVVACEHDGTFRKELLSNSVAA